MSSPSSEYTFSPASAAARAGRARTAVGEEAATVEGALTKLPDHYQQVLRLRYQEQRTFADIGTTVNFSAEAARTLWARAVDQLHKELSTPPPSLPDDDLAEELIARMALYDAALADGADPTFLDAVPLTPLHLSHWRGVESCMRLLRSVYPPRPLPALYPGLAGDKFGRFHIRAEIGRGGFGIVFLADDSQLRRPVALKLPQPETLVNADLRQRFLREARAAAALDHPNLVPVYEAGEVGGICYIASAYCPGVNLAQWLRERSERVPPWMAATVVAGVAEAVQHAHGRGILHRDLKPSNILIVPRTTAPELAADPPSDWPELEFVPRLTDFGLAKVLEVEADQTRSGVILGTPAYMAPEQAEGWSHEVGAATDIYALGVILYEMLAGRLPFRGASLLLTLEQVRSEEPTPPRRLVPNLPRDLETICLKCLRKEPRQRYVSADALAKDLRRFLRGEPIQARSLGRGSRLLGWCRRPQRIRDAAVVALFNAAVASLSCFVGLVLFLCDFLPSDKPIHAGLFFVAGIFGEGLPMAWIARSTSPYRLFPLWAGVFLPFCFPVYMLASTAHLIEAGGMADGRDRSVLMAQISTILLVNGVTSVSYLFALMAYFANRHQPGYTPSQSLPTTIAEPLKTA